MADQGSKLRIADVWACLLRSRRRMKMKSEAEIMPTTDTVSASHNGALATP